MNRLSYQWESREDTCTFELVRVAGTSGRPYRFGTGRQIRDLEVAGFWIATVPVTLGFWAHVAGAPSPAIARSQQYPVENVSWLSLSEPGGFLAQLNVSRIRAHFAEQAGVAAAAFRLPSEAEWEYAARGGPHWRDGFLYSGSNAIDEVAWYDRRDGDHTHPVAQKRCNQLGLYDMSGNVWEWCQDTYSPDVQRIPADGTALQYEGNERVLRGGCFHNWAMHCTVSKRYQIDAAFHDGCIGFRLVFAEADQT